MGFPVTVRGPHGRAAEVTPNGEFITGNREYSEPHYALLDSAGDVFNLVTGKAKLRFVITGILIGTSKSIVGEKTVQIYESLSSDSSVHDKDILTLDMAKSERIYIPLVNSASQIIHRQKMMM